MELFEVINGKVRPSAHALMVDPYKTMWEKDESEDKGEAINVFSYVEFLLSPKRSNPFFGYDEKIKGKEIKKRLWQDENYQSDLYSSLEMIRLVDYYKTDLENASPSYGTLLDALVTAHNTREHLKGIDLNATTMSGTLLLKPRDVLSALKEVPDVIKTLEETRDRVIAELKESAKSRNNREIGFFER